MGQALAKGKQNIISETTGDVHVYKKGLPWLSYKIDDNGDVRELSMSVTDDQGVVSFIMIDEDVDGNWDTKIDMVKEKVYIWNDGQWILKKKKGYRSTKVRHRTLRVRCAKRYRNEKETYLRLNHAHCRHPFHCRMVAEGNTP